MTGRVALVTDSTAYLPAVDAARLGVRVVPLQVVVAGESYQEGTAEASDVLLTALGSHVAVTTSRPSPEKFAAVYDGLRRAGASAVVSVHLSGAMSGTGDAATLAARDAGIPVTVVDSRVIGMALGFAVLAAAQEAARGGDAAAVAEVARRCAARTSVLFMVESLDQLRRGGRVGAAQALVGQALAVKPLLRLTDGVIEPWERVRTSARAVARLEDAAVEVASRLGTKAGAASSADQSGEVPVDIAIHHLAVPGRAAELGERIRSRVPALNRLVVSEVGAVVGAHTGIGMLAIAIAPSGFP